MIRIIDHNGCENSFDSSCKGKFHHTFFIILFSESMRLQFGNYFLTIRRKGVSRTRNNKKKHHNTEINKEFFFFTKKEAKNYNPKE